MGMPLFNGLSDYLLREAEIPELLVHPDIDKLVFLPSGRPLPNPSEHLGSPRMKELVREMKTRYPERLIIFDTPPLLSYADTLVFSAMVDGIVLVVEAEKTSTRDIEKTMDLLRDKPLIGTVYNKAR
jgi:Mrp family chromosome partitioning ATPase